MSLTARLDEHLAKLREQGWPQHGVVVVGVASPRELSAEEVFWFGDSPVNRDGAAIALDESTPLLIGSLTKCFTSAILYQRQWESLGRALGDCLPGHVLALPGSLRAVSLINLVTYSPGLAPDDGPNPWWKPYAQALDNLEDLELWLNSKDFPPSTAPLLPSGAAYSYSNLAWAILGLAAVAPIDAIIPGWSVEDAEAAYNVAIRQMPLSSPLSRTALYAESSLHALPMGHRLLSEPLGMNAYKPTKPVMFPAGALVSTGADMMSWLKHNMGLDDASDPALVQQQFPLWQRPVYEADCQLARRGPITSAGWFHTLFRAPKGLIKVVSKSGATAGFSSWLGFTAWAGTQACSTAGVFVLANVADPSLDATVIGTKIMQLLLQAEGA